MSVVLEDEPIGPVGVTADPLHEHAERAVRSEVSISRRFLREIVELIVAPGQAAARLRYTGHHHGVLLGQQGRGAAIEYEGAAFFRCADGSLTSAWVLGDIDRLRGQIHAGIPRP